MLGFFKSKREKREKRVVTDTKYNIGDKLYYYYKFPNGAPYNGRTSVVSFYVERIHVDVEVDKNRTRQSERYEGASIGCNYYGIAPENLVGRSIEELTAKLLKQGYSLSKEEE